MSTHIGKMNSPCTKVCHIDQRSGLCLGCHRTIEEIARWGSLSAQEREDIVAELDGRKPLTKVG